MVALTISKISVVRQRPSDFSLIAIASARFIQDFQAVVFFIIILLRIAMSTSYNNVQNQGSENNLARGQALFQRFHKATQLYIKQKRNPQLGNYYVRDFQL